MKYKCNFFISNSKNFMILFLIMLIQNSIIAKDTNLKDVFSSSQDNVQIYDSSSGKILSDKIKIYDNAGKLVNEKNEKNEKLYNAISYNSNSQQELKNTSFQIQNKNENKDIKLNNSYLDTPLISQKLIAQIENSNYNGETLNIDRGLNKFNNLINQLKLNQNEIINLEASYTTSNDLLRNYKIKNEFSHSMTELNTFKNGKDSDIQLTHNEIVNQVKSIKSNTGKLLKKLSIQKKKLFKNSNLIKFFNKEENEKLTNNFQQNKILNNSSSLIGSSNTENNLSVSEFNLSNNIYGKNLINENKKLEVKEYTNNLNEKEANLFIEKATNEKGKKLIKRNKKLASDTEEKKKMLSLEKKLNKVINKNTRTLENLKKEYEKLSNYHIKLIEVEEDKVNIDSKIQNQTLLNNKLLKTLSFLKEQNNNELKSISSIKNGISTIDSINKDLNIEKHNLDSKILEVDYDIKSLDLENKMRNNLIK